MLYDTGVAWHAVQPVSKRKSAPEPRHGTAANGSSEPPKKRGRPKSEGGGGTGKISKAAKTSSKPRGKGRPPGKGKGAEKGLSVAAARAAMRVAEDGSASSGEEEDVGRRGGGAATRRSDVSGAAAGSSALSEGVHLSADDAGEGAAGQAAGGESAEEEVPLTKRAAAFAAVKRASEEEMHSAVGGRGGRGGRGRGRGGRGRGRRVSVLKEEVPQAPPPGEAELALWAQGLNLQPWPAGLPVEVVSSEADIVTMLPRSLPVYDNIECGPPPARPKPCLCP